MEIVGRGTAATAVLVLLLAAEGAVTTSAAAGDSDEAAAAGIIRPPCFHACFDQCVLREEYWFCQFSCYRRCDAGARRVSGDCEQACALSMCGQIDPDSKMMAVCRNTCGMSYAAAGCRRRPTTTSLTAAV